MIVGILIVGILIVGILIPTRNHHVVVCCPSPFSALPRLCQTLPSCFFSLCPSSLAYSLAFFPSQPKKYGHHLPLPMVFIKDNQISSTVLIEPTLKVRRRKRSGGRSRKAAFILSLPWTSLDCLASQFYNFLTYVIFVTLLTPAPFSTDTKNTLIPDFLTPKNTKFMISTPKYTNLHFLTPT